MDGRIDRCDRCEREMEIETGEAFLILAALLLSFDLGLLILASKRDGGLIRVDKRSLETAFLASSLACVLIIAAYFRLTMAFVNDAFWLAEVYTYSSSSLAIQYKIGDPWIGSSGSMLFITFIFSIGYFVYRIRAFGRESELSIATIRIMDLFLISLLLITLMKSPFELLPLRPPDGAGLNPLLQTLWVLVHPPVVFLGYAFVFHECAFMLARMGTGRGDNESKGGSERGRERYLSRIILYAAWLFLALGIALGGWWSYEVLGWGGYWAWDPVETASLLPWLALTAYFHLPRSEASRDLMREFTLIVAFFMVIFATALTRGGLLESVHTFGESPVGPALLIFASGVILYFVHLALRTGKPLYSPEVDLSSLNSISHLLAFWSLIFLLIICFMGDLAPIIGGAMGGAAMSIPPEFYNHWCYPFTLLFVAALLGCSLSSGGMRVSVKGYTVLILVIGAIGAVSALFRLPTPNWMANFGLPLLLAAGFAIAYQLASTIRRLSMRHSPSLHLRSCGRALLHIAIIIILIGVFLSSTMEKESGEIVAKPSSTIDALGAKIVVDEPTIYRGRGHIYSNAMRFLAPEYSVMAMNATILDGEAAYNGRLVMYYYTNYGILSRPLIISTLQGDLYVFIQYTDSSYNSLFYALMGEEYQPEDFIIKVKRVPLIWLVWLGVILMTISMAILIWDEVRERSNARLSGPGEIRGYGCISGG